VYSTADSYIVIAAGNDRLFAPLAHALERPDLLDNSNFQSNALRRSHVDALELDMEQALRQKTTREWLDVLSAAGVPCGPINTVADVANDPQVAARNTIVSIADPIIGMLKVAGNPIKLSGVAEPRAHTPPPDVDADRAAILALIGEKS
jgi:CoA:oxalate CoA-transferase